MVFVGTYQQRKVYWADFISLVDEMPRGNWICLATGNELPDYDLFEKFVRTAVAHDILEFKGYGAAGEKLHDGFDELVSIMEVCEDHPEIDVMTTWHNDQSLANAFWQCFFATCLPDTTDYDNLKVICTDLDGVERVGELKGYLKKFELGWLPSSE